MPNVDATKGTVRGFGAVNRFGGKFERTNDKLKFSEIVATRMAGSPEANQTESAFLVALEKVTHSRIAEGKLELLHEDKVVARFSRQPAASK